jgi:hypothetical protein
MPEDAGNKVLTVRVPEDLHKPLRIKMAEKGTTFQFVIMEALRQWLANGSHAAGREPGIELRHEDRLLFHHLLKQVKTLQERLDTVLESTGEMRAAPAEIRFFKGVQRVFNNPNPEFQQAVKVMRAAIKNLEQQDAKAVAKEEQERKAG